MSLYQMQKFLFEINRDPACNSCITRISPALLGRYDLSAEERGQLPRATSACSMCSGPTASC
jgi:hypothetical protein